MSATVETHEFQTEARQLLDLMIHSVYSNKEIFLRELISNASDALDKRRFEAVSRPELLPGGVTPAIALAADPEARTLTVQDNGIGMGRDEVHALIGTIAKSGTREFAEALKASKDAARPEALIGQFGVGFYSAFMVADKVSLLTRRAGEDSATLWESAGDGTYTIQEAEREEAGTTVTLHLKPADAEDGMDDYTQEWVIRRIVKRYSDFVAYPIQMAVTRTEPELEGEGNPIEGKERTVEKIETLNSMQAIWLRDKALVTDEEYNEFYKHIAHDWNAPLARIQANIEGTLEYRMLLYLPERAPFDLYHAQTAHRGVQLYVKRVFIMDDCRDLLPEYLRFLRGVVDSEDLPLNVSREILQQDRRIQRMRKGIVGKTLERLEQMKTHDAETYRKFWAEFGRVLKEGLFQDSENRERLLELALFRSTANDGLTDLQGYLDRKPEAQEAIYYLTGESIEKVSGSPHLEAFRDKGWEVLLLTDPVDEIWVQQAPAFKDIPLRSIGKGEVDLGEAEEADSSKDAESDGEDSAPLDGLLSTLKERLADDVKEVRVSRRLRESPACLVGDEHDPSPQLAQMLKAMGQAAPPVKRILEINPKHPAIEKLAALHARDAADPALAEYAELLYGQALLAEGGELPDPARFSKLLSELMLKTL